MQVEEASYKKYGGFDGVQEARRQQLDLQAASRMKRKAVEAKKVMTATTFQDYVCDTPFTLLLVLSNAAYQFTKWLVLLCLASVKLLILSHKDLLCCSQTPQGCLLLNRVSLCCHLSHVMLPLSCRKLPKIPG